MTRSRYRRAFLVLVWACAAVGLAGCTPAPVEVSGTIKLNGKAPNVKGGLEINFLHPDGRTASAEIKPDGTYTAAQVPVGEVKICFVFLTPAALEARKKGGRTPPKTGKNAPKEDEPSIAKELDNPIPKNLREASLSNLTFAVAARQNNTFDYDIKP